MRCHTMRLIVLFPSMADTQLGDLISLKKDSPRGCCFSPRLLLRAIVQSYLGAGRMYCLGAFRLYSFLLTWSDSYSSSFQNGIESCIFLFRHRVWFI